jgi:hypothetical protein
VEALKAAKEQMSDLKGDILQLENQNSLLHGDLFSRDEEIHYLRWKLGEAEAERARLHVLLNGQSKRKL